MTEERDNDAIAGSAGRLTGLNSAGPVPDSDGALAFAESLGRIVGRQLAMLRRDGVDFSQALEEADSAPKTL